MQRLDYSHRADIQVWWNAYAHAMNISDEIVTGWERMDRAKEHATVGWVDTSTYKLRPLWTISRWNALLVPSHLLGPAQELARYQWDIRVNDLDPVRGIVPVYSNWDAHFSETIRNTAHSVANQLRLWGVSNLTWFIESATLSKARELMQFGHGLVSLNPILVDRVNSKTIFLDEMWKIWVPIASWVNVNTRDDLIKAFQKFKSEWARTVYLKLSRAASGQGVFLVNITPGSNEDIEQVENFLRLEQAQFQMNSSLWVRIDRGIEDVVNSPNIMIFVGESPDKDRFISASSQLLAKRNPDDAIPTVHKWNISWLEQGLLDRLIWESKKVAKWMREQGAYWIVWLDFVVTKDWQIYIMEANYRVNWWLAAAMKWHDLKANYWAANGWVSVPVGTTLDDYASHLQRNQIEYKDWKGVIVLNHATSVAWKMQIAVLWGTLKEVQSIMDWVDM